MLLVSAGNLGLLSGKQFEMNIQQFFDDKPRLALSYCIYYKRGMHSLSIVIRSYESTGSRRMSDGAFI